MTKENIIPLIKQSGLAMLLEVGGMDKCLEHFAQLVAEAEREECALLCEEERINAQHYSATTQSNWLAIKIRAK